MRYISTRELAARWQVSAARVIFLANEGRIPGAKLMGKSWIFPADAEKPADKRRNVNRQPAAVPDFRFPLYVYHSYTQEEIENGFSAQERALYEGELLLFQGRFRDCFDAMEALHRTVDDSYVRMGVLYCLCISCINLRLYKKASFYYVEAKLLYEKKTRYKKELAFILHDLETYFDGNSFYLGSFSPGLVSDYPSHMRAYLVLESAYSDMLGCVLRKRSVSTVSYEFIRTGDLLELSTITKIALSLYLGIICSSQGLEEKGLFFIREGCRIAGETGFEPCFAYLYHYVPTLFNRALQKDNPAQLARLRRTADAFAASLGGLFDSSGKNNMLQSISTDDSALLLLVQKGLMNKEIAAVLNLSMATVSKKLQVLYEKTGVHSKNELMQLLHDTMNEF